jgi:hypothetical protein
MYRIQASLQPEPRAATPEAVEGNLVRLEAVEGNLVCLEGVAVCCATTAERTFRVPTKSCAGARGGRGRWRKVGLLNGYTAEHPKHTRRLGLLGADCVPSDDGDSLFMGPRHSEDSRPELYSWP